MPMTTSKNWSLTAQPEEAPRMSKKKNDNNGECSCPTPEACFGIHCSQKCDLADCQKFGESK